MKKSLLLIAAFAAPFVFAKSSPIDAKTCRTYIKSYMHEKLDSEFQGSDVKKLNKFINTVATDAYNYFRKKQKAGAAANTDLCVKSFDYAFEKAKKSLK